MAGILLNRNRQVPAEETPAFGGIAERFRRGGDLDRAIALCRDGLKRFPDQLSARVTLGWALLDKGQYDAARTELETVLHKAPDNLAAIRGLAELHDRTEGSIPEETQAAWAADAAAEAAAAGARTQAHPAAAPEPVATETDALAPIPVAFSEDSEQVIETPADAAVADSFAQLTVEAEAVSTRPIELEDAAAASLRTAAQSEREPASSAVDHVEPFEVDVVSQADVTVESAIGPAPVAVATADEVGIELTSPTDAALEAAGAVVSDVADFEVEVPSPPQQALVEDDEPIGVALDVAAEIDVDQLSLQIAEDLDGQATANAAAPEQLSTLGGEADLAAFADLSSEANPLDEDEDAFRLDDDIAGTLSAEAAQTLDVVDDALDEDLVAAIRALEDATRSDEVELVPEATGGEPAMAPVVVDVAEGVMSSDADADGTTDPVELSAGEPAASTSDFDMLSVSTADALLPEEPSGIAASDAAETAEPDAAARHSSSLDLELTTSLDVELTTEVLEPVSALDLTASAVTAADDRDEDVSSDEASTEALVPTAEIPAVAEVSVDEEAETVHDGTEQVVSGVQTAEGAVDHEAVPAPTAEPLLVDEADRPEVPEAPTALGRLWRFGRRVLGHSSDEPATASESTEAVDADVEAVPARQPVEPVADATFESGSQEPPTVLAADETFVAPSAVVDEPAAATSGVEADATAGWDDGVSDGLAATGGSVDAVARVEPDVLPEVAAATQAPAAEAASSESGGGEEVVPDDERDPAAESAEEELPLAAMVATEPVAPQVLANESTPKPFVPAASLPVFSEPRATLPSVAPVEQQPRVALPHVPPVSEPPVIYTYDAPTVGRASRTSLDIEMAAMFGGQARGARRAGHTTSGPSKDAVLGALERFLRKVQARQLELRSETVA